ncbi:hypothetical protein ABEF91_000544 [Exophiala dermatitidis]
MAPSSLSETLRSITSSKLKELKKQREQYGTQKRELLLAAKSCTSELERTLTLLEGACRIDGIRLPDDNLPEADIRWSTELARTRRNQQLLLRQAAKDPALSSELVLDTQHTLLEDLEMRSIRHAHADLFSQLVTEWLSGCSNLNIESAARGELEESSSEIIGRKEMHEQRQQWESLVFSKSETGQAEIQHYLSRLFRSEKKVSNAFNDIEGATQAFSLNLWQSRGLFNPASVETAIRGVLQTDLLPEDKAAILTSFRDNREVLQEVADILNIRYASLESWQWTTIDGSIPVQQRRQLNGRYRVFMDEDVLDALLLHVIGMKWAVHFKKCFTGCFRSAAWERPSRTIPKNDLFRREYFLGMNATSQETVAKIRRKQYEEDFLLTQLPINEAEGVRGYGEEDDNTTAPGRKSPAEIKQTLLHLVVTEALIARHLHPDTPHAIVRSDFQWFGPSLPHSTIFAVLEFFGVSDDWLAFFRKFLQAPLRFAQDGPHGQSQARQRGVPMSHALSDVFGEVVLFVMDFAVNKASQSYLYRLHDDFWLWGTEDVCLRGWQAMTAFASVMGIEFNSEKTGTVVWKGGADAMTKQSSKGVSTPELGKHDKSVSSDKLSLPKGAVRWGFLRLDAASVRFVIDQSMVDDHIEELKRQLSHCTSVFSWIQAYNAYMARFFSNNFGQPCNAFGQEHVDSMIDTMVRIQKTIFPDGSVTDYLAKLVKEKYGMTDIPDGVWYWPVRLGGLELRNPLVALHSMRETMRRLPEEILKRGLEADENAYIAAKLKFEQDGRRGYADHRGSSVPIDVGDEFMSKEEYLRYREEHSIHLGTAYQKLLKIPQQYHVRQTQQLNSWLQDLDDIDTDSSASPPTICKPWTSMDPYWKWILAVYGPQILKKYGSVQIVNAAQVPMGMISMMKANKVRWQG